MKSKYDKIGQNYNLTRKGDKYIAERLSFLLKPKENFHYLDIGCGTGNYTNLLYSNGKNLNLVGIDPSDEMLIQARNSYPHLSWKNGSAEKIPLDTNSMDGAIGCLTIHHWSNLYMGFKELNRVLKKNGTLVIFTSTSEQMKGYWLNHYFPTMMVKSIKQMPSYENITSELKSTGFQIVSEEPYFITENLRDLFLYSGKNKPELYLYSQIRKGISSFSSLSNKSEVESGLRKLEKDIDSGRINQIIETYKNNFGDYLFISCKSE